MNDTASPTILIVPGLRDHVAAHWQTLLEQKLANAKCVPRMEPGQDKLSCAAWVAELDKSLARQRQFVTETEVVSGWQSASSRARPGARVAAPSSSTGIADPAGRGQNGPRANLHAIIGATAMVEAIRLKAGSHFMPSIRTKGTAS